MDTQAYLNRVHKIHGYIYPPLLCLILLGGCETVRDHKLTTTAVVIAIVAGSIAASQHHDSDPHHRPPRLDRSANQPWCQ